MTSQLPKLFREFRHIDQLIAVTPELKKMPVIEVSELLLLIDEHQQLRILSCFSPKQQGAIVSDFPIQSQMALFHASKTRRFALIFENMPSENRADLFPHFEPQEQTAILPFLSKTVREDVIQLSAYPPETAGGIMSTDFATVQQNMTCAQAMEKVRSDAPSKRTVYYIYVVNDNQTMQGFITLKDLIMAEPSVKVSEVVHREFIFVYAEEDRESVAQKIEKYDLVALPVLNADHQLAGIVTHDEALEIIRAEQTEDMEKFMGIMPDKDELDYMATSSWKHFKKRAVWIITLAALGILSGLIIHGYESTLENFIILALYMPMVADTGGNSGSQAATVVVRAMALGQISAKDWLKILWKEAKISLLLAICLGVLAFAKVLFLSWETPIPALYSLSRIAFAIALALSIQVITATIIGAGLPILVKRLGGDPAVAASPAITTIVDITGLLIYFGVTTMFFAL
ncbi:magnesium transporter [Sinomicrobium oceani]|uniref:Magnesium transporter MgtE n=2 Tax=Sinomicrobium oceani TaxID=1150368 RepID=A0A1K1R6W7_9FLAO|nr:magnesium transporter [Sinomicrobium oceani]